ncbi:MAG TPA: thioredoxin family protein [Burkholderiales bacterium]|nr:thioredoxin family protein [Burkholderiales bacterium]
MALTSDYAQTEPKRAEVDALAGATLVEFGSPWCGWCRRAQPLIAEALAAHPDVRHIKVADASGKRLGRSFGVKLWPTLVFLRDGKEMAKLVRPDESAEIAEALSQIDPVRTT